MSENRAGHSPLPRYLALCARPMEALLAAELSAIKEVSQIESGQGMVAFSGPRAALYRANLHLRCASRILYRLADEACRGADELYAAAYAIPWEDFLLPEGTLAVASHGTGPGLANSMFVALRVKDAVVDRFRARFGKRPNIDVQDPDLRINVQLYEGPDVRGRMGPRCALSIDSSDPPLHQRGYRRTQGPAPLKETLAAAIVSIALSRAGAMQSANDSPFPLSQPEAEILPLVDLCCGSGTLLIEAGLLAMRRAPGQNRRFGFMRWRDFDAALWQRLLKEAQRAERDVSRTQPFLYGLDLDRRAVAATRRNLETAGLGALARVRSGDLRDAEAPPGPPGIVVCNPPYGERLLHGRDDELADLYGALGETLKQRFPGYTAFIYTANLDLIGPIGLRPRARHVLYNGNLEGRLLELPIH